MRELALVGAVGLGVFLYIQSRNRRPESAVPVDAVGPAASASADGSASTRTRREQRLERTGSAVTIVSGVLGGLGTSLASISATQRRN